MKQLELELEVEEEALARLARQGYDPTYGARPLRRLIRAQVEDPVSEGVLQGRYRPGDRLILTTGENGLAIVRKTE